MFGRTLASSICLSIAQKILEKEVIEGDDLKQMLEASVLPSGVTA